MSILEFVLLFVLPSFPGFVMGAGLIEFGFGVEPVYYTHLLEDLVFFME